MDIYKGQLLHSSDYASIETLEPGKRIATIGNGAAGIQATPALQKVAEHIDHYAWSPTWIGESVTMTLRQV